MPRKTSPSPPRQRRSILQAGDRIGNYVIEALIGSGAEAKVYLAQDIVLQRLAALKVIHDHGNNRSAVEEARVVASLDHPHVVQVYHLEIARDAYYMAMEYVAGSIEGRLSAGGPCKPEEALRFVIGASGALQHAHERGVLHRDLSPRNLLLTKDGVIKLADFGLAKMVDVHRKNDATGFVGTPAYVAPEVWLGAEATPQSDIYSLGGCLHFMLSGHPPFPQKDMGELRAAKLEGEAPIRCQAPEPILQLIKSCLDRRPDRRPTSLDLAEQADRALGALETSSVHLSGQFESRDKAQSVANYLARTDIAMAHATSFVPAFVECRKKLQDALGDSNCKLITMTGCPRRGLRHIAEAALAARSGVVRFAGEVDLLPFGQDLCDRVASVADEDEPSSVTGLETQDLPAGLSSLRRRVFLVLIGRRLRAPEVSDFAEFVRHSDLQGTTFLICSPTNEARALGLAVSRYESEAVTHNIEFRWPSKSDEIRFAYLWTELSTEGSLHWTKDALLLALAREHDQPDCLNRVVHNAIIIALANSYRVVTSWCVVGGGSHGEELTGLDEVMSRYLDPPKSWPGEGLLSRLKGLRAEYGSLVDQLELSEGLTFESLRGDRVPVPKEL